MRAGRIELQAQGGGMTVSLGSGMARAAIALRGNDLYQSPPEAVYALLRAEHIPHNVWEPACGPGAIAKVLEDCGRDVLRTDLVDYGQGEGLSGIDFLIRGLADDIGRGRAIVTNPPFKNAHEFVERALELSPFVAMLLRLAFLESEKRRDILDNGRLSRVHVFRNRLPMMHREGWEGPKATSATPFAWFIWDRSHKGPTTLNRISWEAV
jgi:hypothetical protein